MSKPEKLCLYLVIFNAAYFISTSSDFIKMGSWIGMILFGTAFILWDREGK